MISFAIIATHIAFSTGMSGFSTFLVMVSEAWFPQLKAAFCIWYSISPLVSLTSMDTTKFIVWVAFPIVFPFASAMV